MANLGVFFFFERITSFMNNGFYRLTQGFQKMVDPYVYEWAIRNAIEYWI